jgi:hypothetical protein
MEPIGVSPAGCSSSMLLPEYKDVVAGKMGFSSKARDAGKTTATHAQMESRYLHCIFDWPQRGYRSMTNVLREVLP